MIELYPFPGEANVADGYRATGGVDVDLGKSGARLIELAPGVTSDEIRAKTEARYDDGLAAA